MLKTSAILFASLTAALAMPVAADSSCKEPCATVTKTELKGRPPFKRTVTSVSVAQDAQQAEEKVIKRAEFRGKPPYRKRHSSRNG